MPTSLDLDTIAGNNAISPFHFRALELAMDGDCSQTFLHDRDPISSRFSHPPPFPPKSPSMTNLVSADITYPNSFLQPSSGQPSTTLLSAFHSIPTTTTSNGENDSSPTICPPLSMNTINSPSIAASLAPSSSSVMANNGPLTTHLQPLVTSPPPSPVQNSFSTSNYPQPSTDDLSKYFKNEIGSTNTKRIKFLVQATRAFIRSQSLNRQTFTNFSKLWSGLFDRSGSEPIHWLKNLSQGYATIEHYLADLLYVIYFAHGVDQVAQSESKKVGQGKGVSRQSIAFVRTAKALDKPVQAIKADYRKSRNYMLLLKDGGPGSLLQIGSNVNSLWQHRLVSDDITVLLKYRKDCLPYLDETAHALDAFASEILVVGMVAFGWSYHELVATRSELIDCIRPHVNFYQLAHDTEPGLGITQPLGYSKDRIQKKRQRRDSDNVERPIKRVQPGPIPGEPDISTMIQLSQTPGEPDISTMIQLSQTPGEPDISKQIQLLPMPGELDISTMIEPIEHWLHW